MFNFLLLSSVVFAQGIVLPPGHRNIQKIIEEGIKAPANHPSIMALLGLSDHDNVDDLIKAGTPMPSHLSVDGRFIYTPKVDTKAANPNTPPEEKVTTSALPARTTSALPAPTSTVVPASTVKTTEALATETAATPAGYGESKPESYQAAAPVEYDEDCEEEEEPVPAETPVEESLPVQEPVVEAPAPSETSDAGLYPSSADRMTVGLMGVIGGFLAIW